MIEFDGAQLAVLAGDPGRHARVLGAPGSGKSTLVVEMFARVLDLPGWSEGDVLAIASGRRPATMLRGAIEDRSERALGGTPVRTLTSFAFGVLAAAAATGGETEPRLLTGTVQDELITALIDEQLEVALRSRAGAGATCDSSTSNGESDEAGETLGNVEGLTAEVLRSPAFRAELREFWRTIDDFDLDVRELLARVTALRGVAVSSAQSDAPEDQLLNRWAEALLIVEAVEARVRAERPGEYSASGLLRAAAASVRAGAVQVPRLLLVDDAQEIGEGQLALLAACAAAGTTIWVFGDPDVTTETFHGERSRVLAGLSGELQRRGVRADAEQFWVLEYVYRGGQQLRGFTQSLAARIGAAGAGQQRAATAKRKAQLASTDVSGTVDGRSVAEPAERIEFVRAGSTSEQLGMIAHRMRANRLGLDRESPLEWEQMAVICRSRSEASRVARGLAGHQVPTGTLAGGIVLREHRIVLDLIRLLQHSLGIAPLDASGVLQLLSGPIGGLDPVAVRRLRGSLMMQERRAARAEGREPEATEQLILAAFLVPGVEPAIDSKQGRALRRLGKIADAANTVVAADGTPRETLWALWQGTRLAEAWQEEALRGRGARADEANRSLDAVLGLFFALQRHEEQVSEQPIHALLAELAESAVPEDSLARSGERSAVTVTTPQGAVGREFALVAVVGLQDGAWPNTRSRGTILGTVALERWLRGGAAVPPSRKDTIHDELRLLHQASSRTQQELLVVSVSDTDQHPSAFFGFGKDFAVDPLPSSRLTLRGATAAMRRRLTTDPTDVSARDSLVQLTRADVAGAAPESWYGVLPPSTEAALFTNENGEREIAVGPSQLESVEGCALDWVVGALGGGTGNIQASLGTLVHHAFENAVTADTEALMADIRREWRKLPFDAEWESTRTLATAEHMVEGLGVYLREFDASDRQLIGRESGFHVQVGDVTLRGKADRLEGLVKADGLEITVLDLKTGASVPSKPATEQHLQLQAYQLGVEYGAFDGATSEHTEAGEISSGGARLLYVHPNAAKGKGYVERVQAPLDAETRNALLERIETAGDTMAAGSFTARVEHHCTDPHQFGNCRIHIIQAVSHA
ncbi:PD-(D/E)XK nuclease family protein [Leucobacter sp. cx-328]|uniref:PD-(D/E)XK nuclease family protein n=1 Tax=unclassified Leucobacter TaxID=2621730 RepID=UPI00165DAD5E|nr:MULTISPECIES: PD-(D/E)XK nuclease family protein [unclassified Leucobacter]MBC9944483.1 PD-(D/E)XK nuclease family protein [Leucobacter sp. cx-328]